MSTDEVTSDQGEARAHDAPPPGTENEVAAKTPVETGVTEKGADAGMNYNIISRILIILITGF